MLQGELPAADAEVKAAQEIYRHGLAPDHLVLGRSYLVAGNVASASGSHDLAQRLFEQALSLLRGRDILGTGETYASAGINLLLAGNAGAAAVPLRDALKLLGEISDLPSLAVISRFLAEAEAQSSDLERAMAAVRHAGNLAYQLRDRLGVAWAAIRLAELGLAKGDLSTAQEAEEEAAGLLAIPPAETAADEPGQPAVHPEVRHDWDMVLKAKLACVQASLAHLAGRDEQSLDELKVAARLLAGIPRAVPLHVSVCRELGARLRSMGRLEEALDCLSEALDDVGRCHVPADPMLSAAELAALPSPLWFRN
jgi:tetratricopeptide (TPR) repeat protein